MFRSTVRTLVVLVCLPLVVCLHALGQYDPSQIMSTLQYRQPGLTLVTSHRGEINGPYAENMPENSVGSAFNAVYGGIEMIEADVWTTQDHIPYLAHDKTTYRMLNMQGRGYFNPDPNGTPAVNWSDIQGKTLCAGRGITDVAYGGTGQCTVIYSPVQTVPSLSVFISQVASATNAQGQTWGGVILLDIRDQDSLVQAWTALVNSPSTPRQIVFKFSPLVLGLNSVQDLVNLLAASSYYHGQTGNVEHDLAAYMNFQPTYITNLALKQETASGDPNWAIDDWNNNWLANAGQFHRLLAAEVSVKGYPGEFITADTLYQTVTNGPLNAISMYSGYYECYDSNGPQNLPNLPPGGTGFNGYWINNGLCNTLSPSTAESADGIDHRYDYNFITGHTSPNTPSITNPPNFGMVIADNAFVLINYLNGTGQRNLLSSIQPHCNSGSAYPGCDANGQSTYTLCALEGGTCSFAGQRVVAFGANGSYNLVTVNNKIACNNSTLGPDPIGGVQKACYYGPAIGSPQGNYAQPSVYCADEDGTCNFNGAAIGIFGVGSTYASIAGFQNSFVCNASSFSGSNPAPGLVRTCFYQLETVGLWDGPAGYVKCAAEGQTCQFQGLGRVAFGINGNFYYGVFNGGVNCSVSVFKDPDEGVVKACYYQYATPATSSTGSSGGTGSGTSACDIYASGGTPCVAAHSTVRSLFGSYSGKLYQVQRASDGTTTDIGTLATGGYANAAAQDTFCASTTCTITMIYDQSSYGNNLAIEGGGGAVSTADSGAVANALPIKVNGNAAYGVKVTPGVGYRNNATSGVSRGASPEGIYMVTSGTYVNGGPANVNNGCCFDYGNVETNSGDNGEGHMDALNFGTYCEFTCSGNGPWVEADLENGQYMGNGTNLGDVSMGYDFVTAMLKNDGQTTFALKGGDAQAGGLTTDYSGSLPTTKPGYIPMKLEGAIVLGTGGDNSNWGQGAFFEGAMTSGYPTDATETAVQANIVAAGYTGDSSGGSAGSGGTVSTDPAGTYTGQNDPGGSGPQDGFASPATEQPNVLMGSRPALASFNGNLYVAFQANDSSHELYVTSSSSGYDLPSVSGQGYANIQMGGAPAMAVFNHQLFVAFQANDSSHELYVTSSSSGNYFPSVSGQGHANILMGGAPAMAVFNDQLCVSFQANDASHLLYVTCSTDGVNWPTATQIPNVWLGSDPAMATFNGKLYVAYRSNDASRNAWIASSSDGVNFSNQQLTGQTMGGSSSPALVVSNGVLYYIHDANDQGHEMLVSASTDGSTWQGPAAYLGVQMGATGPGAAAFGNGVYVGFQSNDSRNVLFVTNKVTEAASYTGPSDPGGSGSQDGLASPATEQPNDIMATKPALASFNGKLYVAFQGVNVQNDLYVASSSTGNNIPTATQYTNLQSSSAPALAAFGNKLYMAFRGLNVDNDFYITSSQTGDNFPTATRYTNIQMGGAPALATFNSQLCAAFQANDLSNHLHVTCSSDGVTWPTAPEISNVWTGSDPAMVSFNGKLYIAYRADDSSNNVWIASSSDGVNFSNQMLGQTMGGSSSPALVVSNCTLYLIYGANDQNNEMMVMASSDGSNWQGPKAYLDVKMGATGPGAAAFAHGVSVGFQSNDARNVLFVTNGADGTAFSSGSCRSELSTGTLLSTSASYPRVVRLSHGSSSVNGQIIASINDWIPGSSTDLNGKIFASTDGGNTFTYRATVPTISHSIEKCCATLFELPKTVGTFPAGTLLFAATYYHDNDPYVAIEIYASTDQGASWHYVTTPVSGGNVNGGGGLWEPAFEIANDGELVMFWSDESDSCCGQKIAQIRSSDVIYWGDQTNTVASRAHADRPGMATVSKLPNGLFFMSYEICGPAGCTVYSRTSTDGWNFGDPTDVGTRVATASGQYFEHAPVNIWTPQENMTNGLLLLIGQVMLESNNQVSAQNGETIFASWVYAFEQPHTSVGIWSVLKLSHECERRGYSASSSEPGGDRASGFGVQAKRV